MDKWVIALVWVCGIALIGELGDPLVVNVDFEGRETRDKNEEFEFVLESID